MDADRMKKLLPFLKDTDLGDEGTKRKIKYAVMIAAAVLLATVMVALGMRRNRSGEVISAVDTGTQETREHRDPGRGKELLPIPAGEDNDREILESGDMVSAREKQRRKRTSGLGGLYGPTEYGDGDDPLAAMAGDRDRDEEFDGLSRRAQELRENMNRRPDPEGTSASDRGEESVEDYLPKTRKISEPSRTASKRKPSQSSGGKAAPAAENPEPADPPAEAPAAESERRTVRKSGGISSLDDWGSVEGIGGLDNDEQYVVVDDDKPVKVMFVREQKVKSGSRVTLRLLDDIAAEGMLIPKNTHLSAQCSIGERLSLNVNNIEINGKIINLGYTAYDTDGNEGIYCPTSKAEKNSKQAANNALSVTQSLLSSAVSGMTGLGSSVPGQVVSTGSSIVRSNNGQVEAVVNAGYIFYLLKDNVHIGE